VQPVLARLADPGTQIVSTTVTEQGYGFDRERSTIDPKNPAIAHDLTRPESPQSVIGLIVEGLRLRRRDNLKPFTVMCCDNLPDNGAMLRTAVLDFAGEVNTDLGKWIADTTAFPATMVDRITPASTPALREEIAREIGVDDAAAIETEAFSQWVIQDRFSMGRPDYQEVGVRLVPDVAPYETMKLRMLNGAHSMLAYAGFMAGHKYVRDVMQDRSLAGLVERHMAAAAATLKPEKDINTEEYQENLIKRFKNVSIAHATYQIAMDGSQKLPQRVFAAACDALRIRSKIEPFAFATAAWLHYCAGRHDGTGEIYSLRDPRCAEIKNAVARPAPDAVAAIAGLPGLMPELLAGDGHFRALVASRLTRMRDQGMRAAIEAEASTE
jgi:fructuronate reductase